MWVGMVSDAFMGFVVSSILLILGIVSGKIKWITGHFLMFVLGFCLTSYDFNDKYSPNHSFADEWLCSKDWIRNLGQSRLLHCSCLSNEQVLTLEWKDEAPPPFDTAFLGYFKPISNDRNPFTEWKIRKGIVGELKLAIENDSLGSWPSELSTSQFRLKALLDQNFSNQPSAFLFALSSGNKSYISRELKNAMNHAGLAHLLAVSGFHVGLIAMITILLLRSNRLLFRFFGFVSIGLIWIYVEFCEWPDSAIRAVLMLSLFGLSQLTYRRISSFQVLSLAAWGMLLHNPDRSLLLGTQLSFIAVIAILLGLRGVHLYSKRKRIVSFLLVPIAAQWGTIGLSWSAFGIFPKWFLPFNILATPIIAVVGLAYLGWLIGTALDLPDNFLSFIANSLDSFLSLIFGHLIQGDDSSWTVYVGGFPSHFGWIVSAVFFIGSGVLAYKLRTPKHVFKVGCLLLLALLPWVLIGQSENLEIIYKNDVIVVMNDQHPEVLLFEQKDEFHIQKMLSRRNVALNQLNVVNPGDFWCKPNGDWLIRCNEHLTIGQIKNRPIRLSQLDDSHVSIAFGADSDQLTAWGDPVRFRFKAFNSNATNW